MRRVSRPVIGLIFLSLTFPTILACSESDEGSELTFAHYPANHAVSGIYGRTGAILRNGASFEDVNVCVESKKPYGSPEQIVFETKLAYALWFAAGGYGQEAWELLKFQGSEKCSDAPGKHGSVVVLATSDQSSDLTNQFQEAKMQCTRFGFSSSCQGSFLTMGVGSAGGISYSYFGSPNNWAKVHSGSPAYAVLSPYVDWEPLPTEFSTNGELSETVKNSLLETYDKLISQDDPSLSDLVDFGDELRSQNAIRKKDPEFSRLFQEFFNGNEPSATIDYRPRGGFFHVLLHEVGHQFGMAHADNPSHNAVTGAASNGDEITELATMAYGEPYFFLTADDLAGAKSLAQSVSNFLDQRLATAAN